MAIRPTPADIALLIQLIDARDSAHLAGHRDAVFAVVRLQGGQTVVAHPGHTGATQSTTLAMGRLEELGLFRVVSPSKNGFSFDLVDDVRDRLEEMKDAAGQPSRMGELQLAVARAEVATEVAEAARQDLETTTAAAAAARADLRAAFARRVGRWVRCVAAAILGLSYMAVVIVAGYLVSLNLPLAFVAGVIVVAVALAALDWILHIDGFWLATRAERWAIRRTADWLASFDRT